MSSQAPQPSPQAPQLPPQEGQCELYFDTAINYTINESFDTVMVAISEGLGAPSLIELPAPGGRLAVNPALVRAVSEYPTHNRWLAEPPPPPLAP